MAQQDGLHARFSLIVEAATLRINLIRGEQEKLARAGGTEIQTKALNLAQLLGQLLDILAISLDDPEPTPVIVSEQQLAIALLKTLDVARAATKARRLIQRVDSALVVDEQDNPILDDQGDPISAWTTEQRQAIQQHIDTAKAAVQAAINDL